MTPPEQYFNLALYPQSEELRKLCYELATANCAEHADKYLLGDGALPHVTVCQFTAPPETLPQVEGALAHLFSVTLSLSFRHIYIQYGKGELWGKCWIGLAVKPEPAIVDFQKEVFAKLLGLGIESNNSPESYFPHLTFARCDATKPSLISLPPPEHVWLEQYAFRLTLARSDEHGRYLGAIYPGLPA